MQKIQKVMFVITKGNWGGAQKYVYEMATGLPRDRFEVCVAHGVGDILPQKLKESGIQTIFLPHLGRDVNILKDSASFFTLISLFRKEKPDVVHLNSSKIGGLGALAARIAQVPKIVFTVHGFAFNEDRPFFQKWIIGFISWITIILSTDVICISKTEYTKALQWPGTHLKLHLIYNGIRVPDFLSREEAQKVLATHCGIPESLFNNKTIIGTIGELTKNKGYTYALHGLKDIPDILYIIIGEGEQKEELQNIINSTNSQEKIYVAGFIKNASELLRAFDIFLLPSLKEGIPYVLLEAGLAPLPVVTTPVGGIPEIIENSVRGFFITPASSTSLNNKISELMGNKTLGENAQHQLKAFITESFSVDKWCRETQKVYEL